MSDRFNLLFQSTARVLRRCRTDPLTALVVIGMATALALVLWLLWSTQHAEENWDAFIMENQCIRLSLTEENSRPGWRCADGKVYYRWRQQL